MKPRTKEFFFVAIRPSVLPEMTEIAECTACQLIITNIPLIPPQRTLFPVSSPLLSSPPLAGVVFVFTFHACWNSPPYVSGPKCIDMRRTRSRNALLVTNEDSGLHRRRRLDKLVCLSVSTHASMNTYGVAGGKGEREMPSVCGREGERHILWERDGGKCGGRGVVGEMVAER